MEYNFSNLWSRQFFGFYDFKSFYEYASNKDSQISYFKQLGALQINSKGISEIEIPQELIDYRVEEIDRTLAMIKNQIIVFLFTRYEFMIQETMKCILCDNPELILKFIKVYPDYKEQIGFSLSEFVKCDSKEEYVTIISERLSSRVLTGKPSNLIKRLKCLISIDNFETMVLDDLMIKRNNIVHEGKVYDIDMNELETYYTSIDKLLKVLAIALKNINIHVIDKGQLLV